MAEAVASVKRLISVCSAISTLRYVGLDGRVAELMIHHTALLCYILPWKARDEVAKWIMQQITDCWPIMGALACVSGDDRRVQLQSKNCRDTMEKTVTTSAIVLQLAKALNADGGVIGSGSLDRVREISQNIQRLLILLGHPIVEFC